MGQDIHMYIEYRDRGSDYWCSFAYNIGDRDYMVFGALSENGRGAYYGEISPVVPQKREVSDMNFMTSSDYYLVVSDEYAESEGCCSRNSAEMWVKKGSSIVVKRNEEGQITKITNPDWHGLNWCSPDELEQAINAANKAKKAVDERWGISPFWYAVLAATRALETDKTECRIIYWFDN